MKEQALPMITSDVEVIGAKLVNGVLEVLSHMPPIVLVAGAVWLLWINRPRGKKA